MKYPRVRNIIGAAFSVQTGLDPDAAREIYERALANNPGLRSEVKAALADNSVNWTEMLCNHEDEVYVAESEADARDFAVKLLSSPLLE